jgi:hypothetical protein
VLIKRKTPDRILSSISRAYLTTWLHQSTNNMDCDTSLLEGDVALRPEGTVRLTKYRERQGILARADVTRVITRTALQDAAHAVASGGGGSRGG